MPINENIFKAYDVRGVYPEEINEETAFLVGRACVEFLAEKNPVIIIGRDNRLSSPSLFKQLVKGAVLQGAKVFDIGVSTTPMFYFAVAHFGGHGGIQVTASHNPKQYNGFKIVGKNSRPIDRNSGLEKIKKMATAEKFKEKDGGGIFEKEILRDYIDFNLNYFSKDVKPFKIVVDTANGAAGVVVPEIFKRVGVEIFHLFPELDGSFPNHSPEPCKEENLAALKKEVLGRMADLGIAFDGDGDRIIFVDENGRTVQADLISALAAKIILEKEKKEKILYDIRSSRVVEEVIKENGGRPEKSRIGHSFIVEKMRKENILFGGELSGHFYHRDFSFCEAPFFVIFKILKHLSDSGKNFSEIILPFRKYFNSGEINLEIEGKDDILKQLGENFKGGKISRLDGIRIDFDDWWFLARPSNTEPLLRVVIEAKSEKLLEEKKKQIESLVNAR